MYDDIITNTKTYILYMHCHIHTYTHYNYKDTTYTHTRTQKQQWHPVNTLLTINWTAKRKYIYIHKYVSVYKIQYSLRNSLYIQIYICTYKIPLEMKIHFCIIEWDVARPRVWVDWRALSAGWRSNGLYDEKEIQLTCCNIKLTKWRMVEWFNSQRLTKGIVHVM